METSTSPSRGEDFASDNANFCVGKQSLLFPNESLVNQLKALRCEADHKLEQGRNYIKDQKFKRARRSFEKSLTYQLTAFELEIKLHQTRSILQTEVLIKTLSKISLCLLKEKKYHQLIAICNLAQSVMKLLPEHTCYKIKITLRLCAGLLEINGPANLENHCKYLRSVWSQLADSDKKHVEQFEENMQEQLQSNSSDRYNKPAKNYVREEVLSKAITRLTTKRKNTLCATVEEVKHILEFLHREFGVTFPERSFEKWKYQHNASLYPQRDVKDLRVAFLCDEHPSNDIDVLTRNGVQLENIMAVTLNDKTFEMAKEDLLRHHYDAVQLKKGRIEKILLEKQQKFDIIYFDACASLPSTQNTLQAITAILSSGSLNSPGALITTFTAPPWASSPEVQAEIDRGTPFLHSYLLPLQRLERPLIEDIDGWTRRDSIEESLLMHEEHKNTINSFYHQYFGIYITNQLINTASLFVPWGLWRKDTRGILLREPLIPKTRKKWIAEIPNNDSFESMVTEFPVDAEKFWMGWRVLMDESDKVTKSWFEETLAINDKDNLQTAISDLTLRFWLFSKERLICATKKIENMNITNICNATDFREEYFRYYATLRKWCKDIFGDGFNRITCDVMEMDMDRLAVLILLNRHRAYHFIPQLSQRWQFVSNSRVVFTDLLFFVNCDYFYDWWPNSAEDFRNFFAEDFILGFAVLDAMQKSLAEYDDQFRQFAVTAINDPVTQFFSSKTMPIRYRLDIDILHLFSPLEEQTILAENPNNSPIVKALQLVDSAEQMVKKYFATIQYS